MDFDCKEGHASAAATWFIIGWQLEYRNSSEKVNLTTFPPHYVPQVVGTVDRYDKIDNIPQVSGGGYPPAGRWVTRSKARDLSQDFSVYLDQLRAH